MIRNGYSLTEAMYAVISIQLELGVVKKAQLDKAVVEALQKSIYPPMQMDISSILKSPEGEVRDSQVAGTLIEAVGEADYLIADKGYNSGESGGIWY